LRFELFIASRYLRAKRRQAVIGVITAISILGVAAGVASLIIALAINNGFRQDLQARLLGSTPHVSIMRIENSGIDDWRPKLAELEKAPHVVAAAPSIYEQVLVSRGARAKGVILKGIDPQRERKVSRLLDNVVLGSTKRLEMQDDQLVGPDGTVVSCNVCPPQYPPIILGKDLAQDLGATIDSVILVTSPQGELTPFGLVPKYVRFRVVGIFQSGFYDYDTSWAFTRLSDAQRLFGLGDVASVLEFKIDDLNRAHEVGEDLQQRIGRGYQATTWMDQNKALFRALRLERVVTFITIGLIVLVAALNILISLIMMVMEKTKDIAVLMSMGARRAQIRRIFIAQGVLIGVIGTLLGLVLGYLGAWAGGHYKLVSLSAEVYSIDYVPFAARPIDGVVVAVVAVAISFIATIYPSYAASRILPAEALRYE
jgi:lipoprotein-releasing system permease protein